MKGMELSKLYFEEIGLPLIQKTLPDVVDKMTVGLVGEGSECFGFDDAISKDHDWGAGFCIWLSDSDFLEYGDELNTLYGKLPKEFQGLPAKNSPKQGYSRIGVMRTSDFYYQYTGNRTIPTKNIQWFYVPDTAYATVTNGMIFHDPKKEFSLIRETLQRGYPEDVRCKKLAAQIVFMAQSGQYNYVRALKRNDEIAAMLALSEFIKATGIAIHLLNHTYAPFYKWLWKSAEKQPRLGDISEKIKQLLSPDLQKLHAINLIEEICIQIKEELLLQNLTDIDENFLEPHGMHIMARIQDADIKKMPVLY